MMAIRVQKTAALLLAVLGMGLLAFMIVVEDEPGALPLALIVAGAAWYGGCRLRERSRRRAKPRET